MKRRAAMICLALCLTFAVAGCGDKKAEEGKSETQESAGEEGSSQELRTLDLDNVEDYLTLGEYKGLNGERTVLDVTDADVEYQIESALQYSAEEVTDRAVQEGDIVNIDYVGTVDGVEFEGGQGSNYDLTIGSGTFIEGFEEGLVGASKGQEVDVNVTFPDPYQNNEDLSGKDAVFHVTVNSISQVPELTDEWVASNTEFSTIQEYNDYVKQQLEQSSDAQSDYYLKTALFQQVQDASEVKEYPQEQLDAEVENYKAQVEQLYATASGMTLDDFITAQGYTVEEFEELCQEKGKERLQQKMIVQAIMDAEGITMSQEEYNSMLDEYAVSYGFADKDAMIETYGEEMIKDNIFWDRACEVLVQYANVTEGTTEDTTDTAEEEAAPEEEAGEEQPAE